MVRCGCSNAASSVGVADTDSLDLSLLASVISGDVKIDALPGNLLQLVAGQGLRVDCSDVAACVGSAADVGVLDSAGIDLSTSGAGTPGDPRIISADTKAVFFQTSAITFTRTLAGAADVYEEVTELPDLILTTPGLYIVTMDVSGTATNASAGAGVGVSTNVSAQLRKDGVLVPNTETKLANVIQGNATTTEPALGVAATGSATRAVVSDGTAALTVWASRSAAAGSVATINSSSTGRTRITAWRIGA